MSDERPKPFMMIGLHKLAAQNGDGLVPELYEWMANRAEMLESDNVPAFPFRNVRPVRAAGLEGQPGLDARNDNVVAFPLPHRLRREKH
ncbi:hypothetical protein Q9314_15735 [Shinella sumterensis]|nr:hypothetical protein Q9314_15735 [Shinella sumterensis]